VECLQGRVVDVSLEHPSRKSRVGNAKPIRAIVVHLQRNQPLRNRDECLTIRLDTEVVNVSE
jgi:hypothetical protein